MGKFGKSIAHRHERAILKRLNSAELLMARHTWLAIVSSSFLSFTFMDQYNYYFSVDATKMAAGKCPTTGEQFMQF